MLNLYAEEIRLARVKQKYFQGKGGCLQVFFVLLWLFIMIMQFDAAVDCPYKW